MWLIQRNGLRRHRVTDDPAGTAKWLSASFSPNGRRIQAGRVAIVAGEQQNADVYRMRLDGSSMRNLTNTPNKWESASDWGARPSQSKASMSGVRDVATFGISTLPPLDARDAFDDNKTCEREWPRGAASRVRR